MLPPAGRPLWRESDVTTGAVSSGTARPRPGRTGSAAQASSRSTASDEKHHVVHASAVQAPVDEWQKRPLFGNILPRRRRATTLVSRVPHPRHRRPAQRRQVHAVQRADPQRRAGRELPVRDDRAERRRGAAARPAAATSWRRSSRSAQDRARRRVVRRHRRHRQGRLRGCRAGQQVPGQHPRGRRDLPGGAGVRRRRRRARRRPGRPARPTSRRSTPS